MTSTLFTQKSLTHLYLHSVAIRTAVMDWNLQDLLILCPLCREEPLELNEENDYQCKKLRKTIDNKLIEDIKNNLNLVEQFFISANVSLDKKRLKCALQRLKKTHSLADELFHLHEPKLMVIKKLLYNCYYDLKQLNSASDMCDECIEIIEQIETNNYEEVANLYFDLAKIKFDIVMNEKKDNQTSKHILYGDLNDCLKQVDFVLKLIRHLFEKIDGNKQNKIQGNIHKLDDFAISIIDEIISLEKILDADDLNKVIMNT